MAEAPRRTNGRPPGGCAWRSATTGPTRTAGRTPLALHATWHAAHHPLSPAGLPTVPVLLHADTVRTGAPDPFAAFRDRPAAPDPAPGQTHSGVGVRPARRPAKPSRGRPFDSPAHFAAGFVLGTAFTAAVGIALAVAVSLGGGDGPVTPPVPDPDRVPEDPSEIPLRPEPAEEPPLRDPVPAPPRPLRPAAVPRR